MKYLLDTDVCIEYMRARLCEPWREQIKASKKKEVFLSIIAVAELFYGASKGTQPALAIEDVRKICSKFHILAIDLNTAEIYGDIRASLAKSGTPIGPNDLFVAAIALANGLTLVTGNIAEFSRVPHLQILNWRTP